LDACISPKAMISKTLCGNSLEIHLHH